MTEEDSAKAPAYIVTFTTLTALLLAFFVVLVSMGTIRDETLLDEGEGGGWSFLESFQAGFGGKRNMGGGSPNYYYSINDPEDDTEGRTIDARSERVKRTVKKITSYGAAVPSPITAGKTDFVLTDIQFSGEAITINEHAERFLRQFCTGLQQDQSPEEVRLCVMCVGSNRQPRDKEWALSAKRGKAVEDFLRANLPGTGKWSMYSWGTGPGSTWSDGDKTVSAQPQVLIAILRNDS